jgi:hypothetical protein
MQNDGCIQPAVSARDWEDAHLINALEIHEDDPPLGYRFLTEVDGQSRQTVSWLTCWAS